MAIPAAGRSIKIDDTQDTRADASGHAATSGSGSTSSSATNVCFFSTLARAERHGAPARTRASIPPRVQNYLLDVDHPLRRAGRASRSRVLLTAGDVIHAWWVPAFGMKKDAIPGFINELWFNADKAGTYRGQCAELCGRDHGFMPIVVDVRSRRLSSTQWLRAAAGARRRAAGRGAGGRTVLPIDPATTADVASTEQ